MRFCWENRKRLALEHQRSCFWIRNEKPWIRWIIGSIRSQSWLGIVFYPNLPLYSFRFQFRIVIWVNFNFGFLWFYFSEISLLLIWCFLCKSWSKLSDLWFRGFIFESCFQKYQNPSFLSTFHCLIWLNSKRSLEIILILLGFDPYTPLCHSICDYLIKLVSLVIILTLDGIFSMTSQSRFVSLSEELERSRFEKQIENLRHRFMIGRIRSHDASSSHATWENLSAPSLIEQMKVNGNDSHSSVSSKPLIDDEEPNPTTTPNLAYKYTCSLMI